MADPLAQSIAMAWSLLHAAVYFFLSWLFARTLRAGRVALITRVARRVHGTLAPEIEAYTRRVTIAWCAFFAGQLAVSGLLCAFASWQAWSFFTAALNLPLVALMFLAEYGYRIVRYPGHPRVAILKTLRAFGETALPASDVEAR